MFVLWRKHFTLFVFWGVRATVCLAARLHFYWQATRELGNDSMALVLAWQSWVAAFFYTTFAIIRLRSTFLNPYVRISRHNDRGLGWRINDLVLLDKFPRILLYTKCVKECSYKLTYGWCDSSSASSSLPGILWPQPPQNCVALSVPQLLQIIKIIIFTY